jgi:hypothetical protein
MGTGVTRPVNVVIWLVQGLLALAFLGAGGMKLGRSKEALSATGMTYVDDFSTGTLS